jgi:hypothetical protein
MDHCYREAEGHQLQTRKIRLGKQVFRERLRQELDKGI